MSEIRHIRFPQKDLPLREDVSLMGQLLGEALVEQHGEELLEEVEGVRTAAIMMREGDASGAATLERTLASLDTDEIARIVKAFSTYLRLANLAEKVHRIRRRRTYLKKGGEPQRGSLSDVFRNLGQAGVDADAIRNQVECLRIRPVFTAHPTEATRRSILEKEYAIVLRLVDRLNPDRTPQEEQQTLDRIRDAIGSAWQTSAVPSAKPRVADELDNVLFYLTEILYRVVPPFYEAVQDALEENFGADCPRLDTSRLLRFGSWVGGDMDGNPYVSGRTLAEALETQRDAIIRCYIPEVRRLGRYLSQTRPQSGFLPDLLSRLETYRAAMPEVADRIPARHGDMPYRSLLVFVAARLDETRRDGPHAYADAAEFRSDIGLVARSLERNRGRHAGLFGIRRLLLKIGTFGFHLATLDARQDALVHREVLGELLQKPGWADMDPGQRMRFLAADPGVAPGANAPGLQDLSDAARRSLEVFSGIGSAAERYGRDAIGLFIVSMTQGADDILTVLALARAAGLGEDAPLDIAPLLETVSDLQAGPRILDELLSLPGYRAHVERRGNRQSIMVGYSDSNKDSGIVAARWSLFEAQKRLIETGRQHGVTVQFFHGRGGTVSRGGGNLVKGIEGAPEGTINGHLRVTEQGEVINQKYGIRPIALRNLELMAGAALRHGMVDTGQSADEDMLAIMAEMADSARAAYRRLVTQTDDFIPFFRSATPIDVIERLEIGSRPASRRSGGGIENLRAIPWVFSWAQVRVGLPGVFGVGTALNHAAQRHGIDRLRAMLKKWAFFQGLLNDAEMVLAKSVLDIGGRYAQLADPGHRAVFGAISEEFELAGRHILEIKQSAALLEDQPTLQRNIRLRNPYADPMHLLQIDLLHRWREGGREDDDLLHALKLTVNGIALAIQNTG